MYRDVKVTRSDSCREHGCSLLLWQNTWLKLIKEGFTLTQRRCSIKYSESTGARIALVVVARTWGSCSHYICTKKQRGDCAVHMQNRSLFLRQISLRDIPRGGWFSHMNALYSSKLTVKTGHHNVHEGLVQGPQKVNQQNQLMPRPYVKGHYLYITCDYSPVYLKSVLRHWG